MKDDYWVQYYDSIANPRRWTTADIKKVILMKNFIYVEAD